MTQHRPAAPTPDSVLLPPARDFVAEKRRRWERVLPIFTLAVAVAAAVTAGVALERQSGTPARQPTSTSTTPSASERAAARKDACDAWIAASTAMVATRQPFLDKTQPGLNWDWDDPAIANALVQAESGILAQVEYLRQHVPPATPADVAVPIREFIAANVDLIALDGQRRPAADSNAAAGRSNAAAAKIRIACAS